MNTNLSTRRARCSNSFCLFFTKNMVGPNVENIGNTVTVGMKRKANRRRHSFQPYLYSLSSSSRSMSRKPVGVLNISPFPVYYRD